MFLWLQTILDLQVATPISLIPELIFLAHCVPVGKPVEDERGTHFPHRPTCPDEGQLGNRIPSVCLRAGQSPRRIGAEPRMSSIILSIHLRSDDALRPCIQLGDLRLKLSGRRAREREGNGLHAGQCQDISV